MDTIAMDFDTNSFNILLICVIGLAIFNMVSGYKKGMVKAIISLISMVILCIVATLLAYGIGSYNSGRFIHVALVVILLAALGVVHHLLSVVFFSAKMVAKLPVIHSLDKVLGILFGFIETILILWTVYTFVMMMDLGGIEKMIVIWTRENAILTWFYQHNYLAYGIDLLLEKFSFIPLTEILSLGQ